MNEIRTFLAERKIETKKADDERIAAQAAPEGCSFDSEHWYRREHRDEWSFEIVRPTVKEAKKGVVLCMHGGGWTYGDKELMRHWTGYLASRGYTTVALTYRLLPETDMFGMMDDVVSFICHVVKHAKELDIDTSSVMLTGDSAGSHLSMLAYAILNNDGIREKYGIAPCPRVNVDAICISHPVMCLKPLGGMADTEEMKEKVGIEMLKMMTGREDYGNSPIIDVLSFEDFAPLVKWPPIFITTSHADPWHENSMRAVAVMDENEIGYEIIDWPERSDLGHVFNICWWNIPEAMETNDRMLEFFTEQQ